LQSEDAVSGGNFKHDQVKEKNMVDKRSEKDAAGKRDTNRRVAALASHPLCDQTGIM
jgi:hypothetical protein